MQIKFIVYFAVVVIKYNNYKQLTKESSLACVAREEFTVVRRVWQSTQDWEAGWSHLNSTQEAEGRNTKEGDAVNPQSLPPVLWFFQLGWIT